MDEGEYYIDEDIFNILSPKFEEPDKTEHAVIYKNGEQLTFELGEIMGECR